MTPQNTDPDIEKLRKLLSYRQKKDLADLLKNSRSEIYSTGTFGSHYNSIISYFYIYSPIEKYDILKKITPADKKAMYDALIEIFPVRDNDYEIMDIEFYLDMLPIENIKNPEIIASCSNCRNMIDTFPNRTELLKYIAKNKKCENEKCQQPFQITSNGEFLGIEIISLEPKQEPISEKRERVSINVPANQMDLSKTESKRIIEQLFSRFHLVALTLLNRHASRNTIVIEDEKDAQDLLHALLRLYFDDVRPEEPTESKGGSYSVIDFLLKQVKIGIEIKFATNSHKNKEIKKELTLDKDFYRKHSDCELLLCFVYDPHNVMKNPSGFEKDFSDNINGLETFVYVYPK